MSQPAASRILSEIEAQAGSPLFDRHPKGMAITALGAVCVRHAKVILEELDAMNTETRRVAAGEVGHVRVGAVTGPAVGLLMPAVRGVRAEAPDLAATVEVGPSTELVRGVAEARLDFVIARLPAEYDSRDFRMHPARSELVALLVRHEHPLAGRASVSLEDAAGYDWVIQELASPIRQAVEGVFHANGISTPMRVINSSSLLVVLSLLETTDCIAPLAEEVALMFAPDRLGAPVVALALDQPITVPPCFIIRDRTRRLSSAAQRVLGAVLEIL